MPQAELATGHVVESSLDRAEPLCYRDPRLQTAAFHEAFRLTQSMKIVV
jgi:hypothetical protein